MVAVEFGIRSERIESFERVLANSDLNQIVGQIKSASLISSLSSGWPVRLDFPVPSLNQAPGQERATCSG